MRQDLAPDVAQLLGAVVSRRVGLAVGIWGEPGIGKTHAARAVLERLPCRHLSLHATASEAQIVSALPRVRTMPGWAEAQLARLERGGHLEPDTLGQTLAATLGASAPFVLHLEDLHEADTERFALIESLARAVVRTRGVGLLVTSRAELPKPFHNHRLEPLSRAETAALVEQELKAQVPQGGLEWVFARTLGNPLFALEFVRYLTRQGYFWSDGQRWHWRTPAENYVPITIEVLLEQFVQQAVNTPDLASAMNARAILGPTVDSAFWRAVSGLSTEAFGAARSALESLGILRSGDVAHPLYREVTARYLASEERRVLARRALETLEDDPEGAAAFVDDAELEPEQRSARYQRAAESAEANGRTAQAGRWLARAAEDARSPLRGILAQRAAAHLSTVEPPQAIRLFEIAISEDPSDTRAIISLATQHARMGSVAEMNRALKRLPSDASTQESWGRSLLMIRNAQQDHRGVIALWNEHPELHADPDPDTVFRVGFAYMELNDAARAEALAVSAFQKPDLSPLQKLKLLVLCGLARRLVGDLEAALSFLDQAVECDQACGAANLASSLNNRQIVLGMLGRYPEQAADLKDAIDLYRNAGATLYYGSSLSSLGSLLGLMGQYEEAEAKLSEAHETLARFENSGFLCTNECSLCDLYLAWRPPHGLSLAQRYAQLALGRAQMLEPRHLGRALCAASAVANELGQAHRGLALANECLKLDQVNAQVRSEAFAAKAVALEALGLKAEALGALESARAIAIGEHHQLDLELARLRNDLEGARACLEWFHEHGLMGVVKAAQRKWPELTTGTDTSPERDPAERVLVRFRVLGPVMLEHDNQPAPSRARKRLEILAYLLETRIAGRTEASALELIDALYPETPEPEARKALKQLIYLNRTSLGADSIISTPSGYALGAVSSDAEDFLRSGNSSLWRGTYLGGLSEGWRQDVRDALTLALSASTESLLETDPIEAARLGAILAEMEPFDAQVLRLTVQSLERSGNLKAARTAYRAGRSRLLEMGEALPETMDGFLTR